MNKIEQLLLLLCVSQLDEYALAGTCDEGCGCVVNECCARYGSDLCSASSVIYPYKGSKNTSNDGAPCVQWSLVAGHTRRGTHNFCRTLADSAADPNDTSTHTDVRSSRSGPACATRRSDGSGYELRSCFEDCAMIGERCATATTVTRSPKTTTSTTTSGTTTQTDYTTRTMMQCPSEVVPWTLAIVAVVIFWIVLTANCILLVHHRFMRSADDNSIETAPKTMVHNDDEETVIMRADGHKSPVRHGDDSTRWEVTDRPSAVQPGQDPAVTVAAGNEDDKFKQKLQAKEDADHDKRRAVANHGVESPLDN